MLTPAVQAKSFHSTSRESLGLRLAVKEFDRNITIVVDRRAMRLTASTCREMVSLIVHTGCVLGVGFVSAVRDGTLTVFGIHIVAGCDGNARTVLAQALGDENVKITRRLVTDVSVRKGNQERHLLRRRAASGGR